VEQQQIELLMSPKTDQQPVSDEAIFLCRDKLAAIRLAIAASGLEEKEVYMALQIDKATWSKILSGHFNWPTDGDERFEAIVQNNILSKWQMWKRGYKQPEKRLDAIQELLAAKDSELAELRRENRLMAGLLTGKVKG
jgi:hypothetical protein